MTRAIPIVIGWTLLAILSCAPNIDAYEGSDCWDFCPTADATNTGGVTVTSGGTGPTPGASAPGGGVTVNGVPVTNPDGSLTAAGCVLFSVECGERGIFPSCVPVSNAETLPAETQCQPGTPPEPARPYIAPPTLGEMGQHARDQVEWPDIEPHPLGVPDVHQVIVGGLENSLVLWGYEGWEPLEAEAAITRSVTSAAGVFSDTFTASLVATPVEVRWDTGPTNATTRRHNPPTTVICDGPGDTEFNLGRREFQDWRTYRGYGGPDCLFVWWGLSDDVGGVPSTLTATVVWDLVLTTDWDGAVTNIGTHEELYSSDDWWIDIPSAVGVLTPGGSRDVEDD